MLCSQVRSTLKTRLQMTPGNTQKIPVPTSVHSNSTFHHQGLSIKRLLFVHI